MQRQNHVRSQKSRAHVGDQTPWSNKAALRDGETTKEECEEYLLTIWSLEMLMKASNKSWARTQKLQLAPEGVSERESHSETPAEVQTAAELAPPAAIPNKTSNAKDLPCEARKKPTESREHFQNANLGLNPGGPWASVCVCVCVCVCAL